MVLHHRRCNSRWATAEIFESVTNELLILRLVPKRSQPDLLLVLPVVDDIEAFAAVLLLPQLDAPLDLKLGHTSVLSLALDITRRFKESILGALRLEGAVRYGSLRLPLV